MNLPQTDFPMRGNLPASEPKRLEKWEQEHIYEQVLEKNKDGKPFVLHDGPPYANGPIHIGHAFNKVLKDFVNKSHAQRGYFTPYVPGWDCHGQPIEHMVEVTLGPVKMKETPQPELRRLCREWATKYVGIQRDGFKRLGVNADWDHPYLTYIPNFEAGNVEIFRDMYLKGQVYRGRKPIHWCKKCHTALAEAEIEYSDEVSPSVYVKFKLDAMPGIFEAAGATGDAYVLIWTTTPWTLPANAAVCLMPDADYVMVQVDGSNVIFAKELVGEVAEIAGWEDYSLVCGQDGQPVVLKGKELCGLTYTCPIRQDLKGKIIYGDHVTLDSGTGCVHTAPGHGQDDYLVGLQFDIPILMPVDDNGVLTEDAGPFAGLDTDDANPVIIDWLREQGTLVAARKISHSYPHCWRCHEPVIFRATDQWFVSMEENGLRGKAMDAIERDVTFYPGWAVNRIGSMVSDRPDWCISRQRSWGVPIPVFKCAKCGETVANEATFDAVIKLFYEEGADAWFTKKPSEYLPHGTHCEKCGCTELVPEKDILDVWWDSGVSHTAVCKHRDNLEFPADMYLEGSDQHRGWFMSSLMTSVGAYGTAPYKAVVSQGFTLDGQGRKMSKSLGNVIDPNKECDTRGADVMRLWVSSVDTSNDVTCDDEILSHVGEAYRKIRNTLRFLLGEIEGRFDPATDAVAVDDLAGYDKLALARLCQVHEIVTEAYEGYRFNVVYRNLYDYVTELSNGYLNATKDRVYCGQADGQERRSALTVWAQILSMLVHDLQPILAFTCDEVMAFLPESLRDGQTRAALLDWYEAPWSAEEASALLSAYNQLVTARDVFTKAFEEAKEAGVVTEGTSQAASATLTLPADVATALADVDLAEVFVCAAVEVVSSEGFSCAVAPAVGEKCPRCWNVRELGGNANHPHVCERCGDVLDSIGFSEED